MFSLGNFGNLLSNFGRPGVRGDDEDVFDWDERQYTVDGLLKEGAIAEQRYQLFGRLLAADGPKAFALAARHNDHETIFSIYFCFMS